MSTLLVSLTTAAALALGGAPLASGSAPLPLLSQRTAQPAPEAAPPPSGAPATAPPPAEPAPAPAPAEAALAPAEPAPAPAAPVGDPAAATQPPAPIINVTVQQPPAPAPQPPPPPPVTAGRGLLITGGVMMGVGGASLLFVALPSAVVRDVALSRAERDDVLAISSREARYNRARRADDAMEAGFWIGAPMLVAGVAILITGVVVRNAARNRQSRQQRVAATPGGVTVRF